jgi:hypothetical protein
MKALADYVHSKGLKIGIYSGPGAKTCAGYRGLARPRGAGRQPTPTGASTTSSTTSAASSRRDEEAGPRRQGRADEAHDRRLREDGQGSPASRQPAAPSSTRSASTAGTRSGSGRRRSAATSGAPPATSTPTGTASTHRQPAGRPRQVRRPRPLERPRHARGRQRQAHADENRTHFSCGPCSPRRCSPATTCPT